MSVAIPLRNRRGDVVATAHVDSADARLAEKRWYLLRNGYAVRTEVEAGKKRMLYLHREVLGLGSGAPEVDHRNRDKLDCRRRNLRVATRSLNCCNRGANRARSLPRNVYQVHGIPGFKVQLKVKGRTQHVGMYPTVGRAASAARSARSTASPPRPI